MSKFLFGAFAAFLAVVAFFWAAEWGTVPMQTASVSNVRAQWADGYSNYAALESTAANICSLRTTIADPSLTIDDRSQYRAQVTAQEQNFTRVSAMYNTAMRNGFAAKYVKPIDLPAEAPSLTSTLARTCP